MQSFPQGVTSFTGATGWLHDYEYAPDDFGFVLKIATVLHDMGFTGRRYAVGFSNGAQFAQRIAVHPAMGFQGIAPGATQLTRLPTTVDFLGDFPYTHPQPSSGTRRTAVFHYHGTSDGIIPYNGGVVNFLNAQLSSSHKSAEFWAELNGWAHAARLHHPDHHGRRRWGGHARHHLHGLPGNLAHGANQVGAPITSPLRRLMGKMQ